MATAKKPSAAKKALVAKRRKAIREASKNKLPEFVKDNLRPLPVAEEKSIFQKARELPPMSEEEEERSLWIKKRDEQEEEKYQRYLKRCDEIRDEVIRQAGDDFLTIPIEGDPKRTEIRVPRAPFYQWALGRVARHLAPKWEPVAPSGMKLQLDDPYHTDWMLGAGLSLEDDYGFLSDTPINKATSQLRWEIMREHTSYEGVPFSHGKVAMVEGTVGKEILVVPDLRPFRQPEIVKAKAVLTNVGGALAHLAIIAREESIPMFMIPKATEKFPPGSYLHIYTKTGSVHLSEKPFKRWSEDDDTILPKRCANCDAEMEGTMLKGEKDDIFCDPCVDNDHD